MMTIKVECPCGQHFVFDVEPIEGRMPSRVACPVCGADGTEQANAIISHQLGAQSVPPRAAPVRIAVVPPAQTGPRNPAITRRPRMDDESTRELIEAKLDVRRASTAGALVAGLSLVLVVLSLFGVEVPGVDLWMLVDVALVAGLAFGVYRFSRTCAILLLIYYIASSAFVLIQHRSISGIVVRAIFLYYFGRGVQAAFTYHKLSRQTGAVGQS